MAYDNPRFVALALTDLGIKSFSIDDATGSYQVFGTNDTAPSQSEFETAYDAAVSGNDLRRLRKRRNALLTATDWWAGSDHTMTQAQTDYRQALRDITDTYSSLSDVVWPTKPE